MHTIGTIMKDMVNLRIHIAPVAFEVDRIVISAVRMKADKVWLIAHDNAAEDKANEAPGKLSRRPVCAPKDRPLCFHFSIS